MQKQKSVIITWVLVMGAVFLITLGGFLSLILEIQRSSLERLSWEKSFHIAEAGINYYKWHLQHFPEDIQDGQSWCCNNPPCTVCGPYQHEYKDSQGNVEGHFSLEISSINYCGHISSITVTSTGWTDRFPHLKRKVRILYAYPTIADYAYILNENVWAGPDREIKGPYLSNKGIRMDGENKSTVSSAKSEWICTSSFGCDVCPTNAGCHLEGSNCVCPGVFTTANGNSDLFKYPVTPFDFDGITVDLANVRNLTKNQGQGLYFGPSGVKGYYIYINQNSLDVYKVTSTNKIYTYDLESGWHWEESTIKRKSYLGNYSLPGDCSLVFVEDNLWIEGEIGARMTIISANLEDPNEETDIWLPGDITYKVKDGTNELLLVGQRNVLIAPNSPDSMEIAATVIAQKGHFGRNYYSCWDYPSYCIKDYLEMYGAVVSNGRVGTQWTNSWGGVASGYKKRENIYDPNQSLNAPPFLPKTSEEMQLISWKEVK